MRLLVIEDYAPLRESLIRGLRDSGYAVDASGDGREGLWYAEQNAYDALVLDLMLPGVDGLEILRRLRARGDTTHVLILTARDTVADRVAGLDLGADDYLVKPFAFDELLARLRALLRRRYQSATGVIEVGDLVVDTGRRTVARAGVPVPLTAREYALLEYLACRRGAVVSRSELWEHVYDFAAEPESNVLDVYVSHLRRKIDDGHATKLIHTRRGQGYLLDEAG
ncbi:MAG TPA: response regulator transcription factor [Kofleriaceae bacterium]|nr:response regulator transcription factor [Kofleriaceae bacterium]